LIDEAEELFRLARERAPEFREALRKFATSYARDTLARDVLRSLAHRQPDPFIRRAVQRELADLGIDLDPDPGLPEE
jgi:hypothetical protein